MTQSFDRRSFLAGGLALGAGAAAFGTLGDAGVAGAYQTNGRGRNGISTARPVRGGSVTFGIDTEEGGFNPSTARWDEGGFLYGRTVFDPLAIVNAAGGVEPYLAESITSNADFTAFTITLRPNIVFHDGTPLDANALHLNIEQTATGVLTGPAFADFSSATVTGPLSVTINLKAPWAPFPYYLAQAQTGYIAAPSMLNSADGGTANPIGTGPFVFQDWVPNSHMTATRNPHYWRKGYPYLNSITYKPIINDDSRADALETGEIDMMHSNSPNNLLQFRGNKKYSYYDNSGQIVGQPTVQCIMLNTSAPPFNNKTLRTAMAKCVNQTQFAKVIDKGIDTPMNGLFLPGSEYYTKTAYPAYDPSGATKLVKQVQQQTGKQVSFTLNSDERPRDAGGSPVPAAGLAAGGHKGQHQHLGPGDDHRRRAGRQLRGHAVAPVRCGRPRSQLCVVEHDDSRPAAAFEHGPQQRHPDSGGADRGEGNEREGGPGQGLPADQSVPGRGHPLPLVGPRHLVRGGDPERAELRQPDDAAGLQGDRLRRGRPVAGADLDVLIPQRISTSSRYSSRQWVKRSSGSRRQ